MQITDEIRAKNLYEVLGLKTNTASREEIAKAYRTLAMKFHPDKNPGDQAAATKFKEMNEAYEILGSADPAVRDQYDRSSPHGSHYSEDAEEEQGSFAAYASFFAQMRFLMLINLLNIFTWSPQPNPFTPMPKIQLPP
jgi:DnaJ-class molecular chaperone